MKRLQLTIFSMLLCVGCAMAVPAHRGAAKVKQPDGSYVTIRLHGDEWLSFNTTEDGYTVVKDARGSYVYALLSDGQLQPTSHVAHDAESRTAAESAFLAGVRKYQAPAMTQQTQELLAQEHSRRAAARQSRRAGENDYSGFRGLVILVEFKDRPFERADYFDIANDMLNADGYTGYDNTHYGRYTGSVRDYFVDNSMGLFKPEFDVIGPVQVDYSQYDVLKHTRISEINYAVLQAVDDNVDFSQYDSDGDGIVDMIYFIYSGLGSNMSGNDERLLWPHASFIVYRNHYVMKDGVYLGRYACSTELYGTEDGHIIDGIGTICHEFSHVLGLEDLYDTDYEESGGTCDHPGIWSVMAGGSYENYSRTPVGYSLYERYSLGFGSLETIDGVGDYELEALPIKSRGYRINSSVKDEFFLLENRQKTSFKWDTYLPGSGLLVHRVDSTNQMVWQNNTVNANPAHGYYQVVRAGGTQHSGTAWDVFPGTGRVTQLDNGTSPANLLSWSGEGTQWGLSGIADAGGVVTFSVVDALTLQSLSLPETFVVGLGMKRALPVTTLPKGGHYELEWESSNPSVAEVDEDGTVTGVGLGTCTITVRGDNDCSASAQVTVEEIHGLTIAEFKAQPTGSEVLLQLTDAEVLYVYQTRAYVRDATGSITFSSMGLDLQRNDRINGFVYAKPSVVNSMPQASRVNGLTNADNLTILPGDEVQPREVKFDELTTDDFSDYVLVKGVQLVKDVYCYAKSGDRQARVYQKFGATAGSLPTDYDGNYYDVPAIYGTAKVGGKLIAELYLVGTPTRVEPPTGISEIRFADTTATPVYNLHGQRVNPATAKGLLIKGGRKYVRK